MSTQRQPESDPKALVQHVAKLARLSLSEAEADRYSKDMSNIFAMVNQLSELNFDESNNTMDEASLPQAQPTIFRDDVIKPRPDLEVMLKNAPLREGDFFRVPKITDN